MDYGANFSHMLGFDSPKMQELMRLYVTIHRWVYISHLMAMIICRIFLLDHITIICLLIFKMCSSDHEGGNVSAHTGHLVSEPRFVLIS